MEDQDDRIRRRAHEIWKQEGSPEGREYSHWLRARAEIREEDANTITQDLYRVAQLNRSF
ncbi:DUF2934 domain-containing protein [Shinella sp. AETb1-6]|uniref:DUF2934 domain-containing protein n=2 Tax=Shinella TaxID=323620 RepID=A0AA50CIR5_9HYPH|nr:MULTISPECIES: DUF2934 domain-containing protein [Shinella]MCD1266658.1 DUF2934 domain-containing protein [Shinella sumterensis]MXN50315.1 DUF2934 domain-containing protein [Shinella sp. AETb1-6]TFE96697.1 hypothetical protein B5M44_18890 [Shinella sumterensis]WLR96607.1 DUF2934 domain-containing protein [Shinella sumterensis]WLS04200.1 DUF2934 domain-containing protein [Shinella oryzae]